jgi:hypothetical protein
MDKHIDNPPEPLKMEDIAKFVEEAEKRGCNVESSILYNLLILGQKANKNRLDILQGK